MALTIRAAVEVRELSRDLRSLGEGLDKPIRDTLTEYVEKIRDIGAGFMRHGQPSWPSSSAAAKYGSFPGAIASYYDTRTSTVSANIGTRHPAGPVWEWGGDIHPRAGALHEMFKSHPEQAAGHQTITIPRLQPMVRAADQEADAFERALDDAVDRLIAEYGF
jgi:hypothetical protein